MSYKAYKDSDGNYDIRSSKDDAMYGIGYFSTGIIINTIILTFKLLFKLFDKGNYTDGTLLGTDSDSFILSIDGNKEAYLIKDLESVHYKRNGLKLEFKGKKGIAIFKNISAEEAIEQLEPLYDLLDEEKVIVTLHATNEVNEWFEKYLKGETKKKVEKTPTKILNEPYKKMYKIINGEDMQELEMNTQYFLDTLGMNVKEVQIGAICKVDESYCQNISYLEGC